MLCCLFSLASIAKISSKLTRRPSIQLTTRCTYRTSNGGTSVEALSGSAGSAGLGTTGAAGLLFRRWFRSLFFLLPCLLW